jgi:hypothetical protein
VVYSVLISLAEPSRVKITVNEEWETADGTENRKLGPPTYEAGVFVGDVRSS